MPFPGSEELVAAAETQLGRRLPEAHRVRLARENGGEVRADRQSWTLYPVWDASNRRTIARTANHILRENEAHRRDWPDILPPNHFAIADNVGGDLLVLGPEADTVLFWDHETGALAPVVVKWD